MLMATNNGKAFSKLNQQEILAVDAPAEQMAVDALLPDNKQSLEVKASQDSSN